MTDESEVHPLIETPDGVSLRLWDTPGFGDSARLLKRLRMSRNPIGWLLTQVWDRFLDRPLYCSQQAVVNVRDQAEIVLYLVNSAEDPESAPFVEMEMEALSWIGKPVLVLLNQTGKIKPKNAERKEEDRWHAHLKGFSVVKDTLSLDAFARCWVQEGRLLKAVASALRSVKQDAFQAILFEWRHRNLKTFDQSMAAMGRYLSETLEDAEPIPEVTLRETFMKLTNFGTTGGSETQAARESAMEAMTDRLSSRVGRLMDELLELHGLEGDAADEIQRRLTNDFQSEEPVSAGLASVVGGMFSGAIGGVVADLMSGGLTFGGGAVVGGVLGAASAAGIARGFNVVKNRRQPCIRWSDEFVGGLFRASILRYLAVAHFGRGRGGYCDSEHPEFWRQSVETTLERHFEAFQRLLKLRDRHTMNAGPLSQLATVVVRELLICRYPDSIDVFDSTAEMEETTVS